MLPGITKVNKLILDIPDILSLSIRSFALSGHLR